MTQRIVVIGGTAAGMSAAAKAKREKPELEVIVFEETNYISYGSCGLPYYLGDIIDDASELSAMNEDQAWDKKKVKVHTHHRVTGIDPEKKKIQVKDLEQDKSKEVSYDYLVIATGAKPIQPPIPGIDAEGVHVLRTVESGIGLKKDIIKSKDQRVGILGGGLIGLETAGEVKNLGNPVHVFEMQDRLISAFPEKFSDLLQSEVESNGIEVHLGAAVNEIEKDEEGKIKGVKLASGEEYPLDVLLVSIGIRPRTELAKEAGLELNEKGGIIVDDYMKTSNDSIYACGDCIQMKNRITGKPDYVPLGTTANKTGRLAGANIAGAHEAFQWIQGSQISKICDIYIGATGLNEERARKEGFDVDTVTISQVDQVSYYPGQKKIWIHLIFEKKTGRILGAQLIGSKGVAGRTNVFVVAVSQKMTIKDVNDLDLVYAPPVAPVYDPILIASSQALKKMEK